jgi:hypothetical protein
MVQFCDDITLRARRRARPASPPGTLTDFRRRRRPNPLLYNYITIQLPDFAGAGKGAGWNFIVSYNSRKNRAIREGMPTASGSTNAMLSVDSWTVWRSVPEFWIAHPTDAPNPGIQDKREWFRVTGSERIAAGTTPSESS